ncbi:Fcf1-domain-containing protein [Phyllosticta citribraziliensis]|uniref:Fcf1-domain-containing protein n=1 Tax=Phyllosticta citribraziliensis TaxID=989973 RepID=A0ABR1LZX8_9PEZI
MRGKRAKQYRKLMHQYGLTFGFREPYQVLVDADMVKDTHHCKMDLAAYIERTLQGKTKIMITQCSMRHLYADKDQQVIAKAQEFERRRCNHHTLEEPLSTLDCLSSVVDPSGNKTNKHRYVVASQEQKVRSHMRQIPGVPLVYMNRSVMIMEPMANATEGVREKAEHDKFKAGIKTRPAGNMTATTKRKREEDGEKGSDGSADEDTKTTEPEPKKKRKKGPKGPNPLSVKKAKKPQQSAASKPKKDVEQKAEGASEEPAKRKRRRKPKTEDGTSGEQGAPQEE